MRKMFLMLLMVMMFLSACSKVPAGNVGIKFYLLGKDKGVDSEELGPGRYYIGWNEELYLFPTFKQQYVWTKDEREGSPNDESITFQTKEGMAVNADIGIDYHLEPTKISDLFQKYKRGIAEITGIFLRNEVRDAFVRISSTFEVEKVYGEGKAKLLNEVNASVKKQMADSGIVVEKIYAIGKFTLPETVVKKLNEKIEAIQKAEQAEYQLREETALAQKVVIKATAEAKAMALKTQKITPLLVRWEAVQKWDGKLPVYQAGKGIPLINLK